MFTGIIQHIGKIERDAIDGGDARFVIHAGADWLDGVAIGNSIAVNGVCLTVTQFDAGSFTVDVSRETLDCSGLGQLPAAARVNLEKALRTGDALGGHLVSGHVDAVARILDRHGDARSQRLTVEMPPALAQLIASKGNICVDGTSLTVNDVGADRFGVNIVPHTLVATIAGDYERGTIVNLEVDLIARYVARVLGANNLVSGGED